MAINIRVDRQRMSQLITVDEYIALIDGDIKTMVNVLSNFVTDDVGEFIDKKVGRKLIGGLSLDELKSVVEKFTGKVDDAAVPPKSGAGSS